MIILRLLSKLIKVLRAGPSPTQIAGGFVLGMFLGFMPIINLYALLVVLLILFINVNISAAIFGWMVFSIFAYLLDPVFHDIGFVLLVQFDWLKGFWATLYNLPLFPLSKYNNTVVLGSLVSSLVLLLPIFWLAKTGVIQYREKLEPKVQKIKLVRLVKGSSIYNFYIRLRRLGD